MTVDESFKQPSLFYYQHSQSDQELSQAIKFWEDVSTEKYSDVLGYFLVDVRKAISAKDYATKEHQRVEAFLNQGTCQLLTGYDEFDIEQIKPCYDNLSIGRKLDFISVEDHQYYLKAESDWQINYEQMLSENAEDDRQYNLPGVNLEQYFSRKWIAATEVQALVWYREFLLDIMPNGLVIEQKIIDSDMVSNKPAIKRTRKVGIVVAIEAAIRSFGRKPSLQELWKYFHDENDATGIIVDFTDTKLTWTDSRGTLHDTKKETIANHLAKY